MRGAWALIATLWWGGMDGVLGARWGGGVAVGVNFKRGVLCCDYACALKKRVNDCNVIDHIVDLDIGISTASGSI